MPLSEVILLGVAADKLVADDCILKVEVSHGNADELNNFEVKGLGTEGSRYVCGKDL